MAGRAPHRKIMSEEDRLAKNARIKASVTATRERRKTMIPRVREIKIARNKLTAAQREDLVRLFLEAKWLRNAALAASRFDTEYLKELGDTVPVRLPGGTVEHREFRVLGGQLKQAVIAELNNNRKSLAAAKKRGRRVGKLKFTSEVSSINLAQFGGTHKIDRERGRVKVANVRGWLKAGGLSQLDDADEYANAKVVQRPDGYYLLLTTYTHAHPDVGRATQSFQSGTAIGIDMGVSTHITLSDGRKFDAMIEETDRLKRLRRKLCRQQKGSANHRKTKRLIRVELGKIARRKEDLANKFVHEILKNERVYIQDENIPSWKTRSGYVRGGKRVQHSILGRVKQKLASHDRVTVLGRYVPTTATCICGVKTPHHVSQRTYTCPECGYTADRDVHAAENMIRLGSDDNPACPEQTGTPVEIGVRLSADMDFSFMSHFSVRSAKQEAATSSASP